MSSPTIKSVPVTPAISSVFRALADRQDNMYNVLNGLGFGQGGAGWSNPTTGMNDPMRDKRAAASFRAFRPSYGQLNEWYRGSDTAARIVDKPVEEMYRLPVDVVIGDDRDAQELCQEEFKRLDVYTIFEKADKLRRALGGAGVLVGADDGREFTEPLDLNNLKSIDWLTWMDNFELIPDTWYADPANPKYGQPEIYRVTPLLAGGPSYDPTPPKIGFFMPIHESRVIAFHGIITTRWQSRETRGWGDSMLARVMTTVRDFETGYESAAILVQDFAQAVFKMKGLAEALANHEDDVVMQRLRIMDMCRSVLRAAVLDADKEDFQRVATPVAGLADILREQATRLAMAADMPVTVLMGVSPAGLNATGASDIRLWYDRIANQQTKQARPPLTRLLTLLFRAKNGPFKGVEPEKWSLKFRPLYQLTDQEDAALRFQVAQTDAIEISNQIVTPEEVAASRHGASGYSRETVIDLENRKVAKAAEQQENEEPEPLTHNVKPPGGAGNPVTGEVKEPGPPRPEKLPGGRVTKPTPSEQT